jgi:GcrA cell cycle regulator
MYVWRPDPSSDERADHKADSMEPSNWASAHSDALRDFFVKGMSFSEIGKEINARFGTSYTRSAVIGRARRMGLEQPRRMESPPIAAHLPDGSRPAWSTASPLLVPPKSAFKAARQVKLRSVGIQPRLIPLLELRPGDCRYPYGGDKEGEPISFCGHPRQPGSSYCAPHFRLTAWPGTGASGRTAGAVILRLVAAA